MSYFKRSNRVKYAIAISVLFLFMGTTLKINAQTTGEETGRKDALNVFFDCRSCDMNYVREEIPYINYVRDVRESQLYILVTSQDAGSGGSQYTIRYQGQLRYTGMNDTLTYNSSPNDTRTEIRDRLTNMIKMGLMRYVARTPIFNEIEIGFSESLEAAEVIDRWNNWVFELQTSPELVSESSYKELQFENSVVISKVTTKLKFITEFDQNVTRKRYIEEDTDTTYIRGSQSWDNLLVFSLNDHWSAGLRWDLITSTQRNYDFNTNFLPSVEYNLFPYSEATHRQMRFLYSLGYEYSNYTDSTIYNMTSEGRFKHEINMAYEVQQKWGTINVSLSGSSYFYDISKARAELDGFVRVRIFKGLSLSLRGGVAYINDQLSLKKGELSEAERLLRLREQATSYQIEASVGITYTFGSIYNNVVNPRFGN